MNTHILLLVWALASSQVGNANQEILKYLEHGNRLQASGQLEKSKEYYEYVIQLDDSVWQAWTGLGNVAYSKGQWAVAAEAYENALNYGSTDETLPNLIRDLRARGISFIFGNNFAKAKARARLNRGFMLLYFDQEESRCSQCPGPLKLMQTSEALRPALHKFVGVRFDGDWSKGKTWKYKVAVYPTLICINLEGRVLGRLEGPMPDTKLEEFIRNLASRLAG